MNLSECLVQVVESGKRGARAGWRSNPRFLKFVIRVDGRMLGLPNIPVAFPHESFRLLGEVLVQRWADLEGPAARVSDFVPNGEDMLATDWEFVDDAAILALCAEIRTEAEKEIISRAKRGDPT